VIGGLAGRALAAHVGVGVVTRVPTLQAHASLVSGAIVVSGALSIASRVRISQEVWRTCALSSVVYSIAVRVFSAYTAVASRNTPV